MRELLVREHHQRGITELASVNTHDQLADQLTKTNSGPQIRRFRNWLLRGVIPTDANHDELAFRAG